MYNYMYKIMLCSILVAVTMAMMDNKAFLISHIRNSFITSDDTGMCEMIIEVEDDKNK